MKYERKAWYFWTAYSIGYVKRDDGQQVYPPHYDRRHNLNFLGTYDLKKNGNSVHVGI